MTEEEDKEDKTFRVKDYDGTPIINFGELEHCEICKQPLWPKDDKEVYCADDYCECSVAEKAIYKLLKEIKDHLMPPVNPNLCHGRTWFCSPTIDITTPIPGQGGNTVLITEHEWEKVEDTASKPYYRCKKCGERREL